ncbi:hypothetical protein EAH_00036860 [Eimeria acervulina]|uniref:Uncharacterized protein n=1 Tax=Eimeria acervulina TaxID=5801 RepID=U6GXU7_EIMAC|nr:hypothetical protein EAH_00036860 [Eimeria acervulina]CDI83374.1 hypothetical protein EAH_00036860 [Eimeria acervulina]
MTRLDGTGDSRLPIPPYPCLAPKLTAHLGKLDPVGREQRTGQDSYMTPISASVQTDTYGQHASCRPDNGHRFIEKVLCFRSLNLQPHVPNYLAQVDIGSATHIMDDSLIIRQNTIHKMHQSCRSVDEPLRHEPTTIRFLFVRNA